MNATFFFLLQSLQTKAQSTEIKMNYKKICAPSDFIFPSCHSGEDERERESISLSIESQSLHPNFFLIMSYNVMFRYVGDEHLVH
jgi:hypothetical protein